jgi:hypothetical protein
VPGRDAAKGVRLRGNPGSFSMHLLRLCEYLRVRHSRIKH